MVGSLSSLNINSDPKEIISAPPVMEAAIVTLYKTRSYGMRSPPRRSPPHQTHLKAGDPSIIIWRV